MKWHRVLFWLLLVGFYLVTIGAEGEGISTESVTRFALFLGATTGIILLVDKVLFPTLGRQKRYVLFSILLLVVFTVALLLLQGADRLLFGPAVNPFADQLLSNAAFIIPWVVIALCLLIAENHGHLRLEKTRYELLYLRHQINPHFLLNTHNNIHFLIEQDPALASQTLLQLSGIMQYMLYETSADRVPLSKEVRNLLAYINLERIRKEPTLEVVHNLEEITTTTEVAPLLFLSFIENAFKHVSHHTERNNFIHIHLEEDCDGLRFSVENTTDNSATVTAHSGIGLANVKQRLRLLYPGKHRLTIKDEDGIYSVLLTLKLH